MAKFDPLWPLQMLFRNVLIAHFWSLKGLFRQALTVSPYTSTPYGKARVYNEKSLKYDWEENASADL